MSIVFSDNFNSGSLTGWGSPNSLGTVNLWGFAGTYCVGCTEPSEQSRKTFGAPISNGGSIRAQVACILTTADATDGALLFAVADFNAGVNSNRYQLLVSLRPDSSFRIRRKGAFPGVFYHDTAAGLFPVNGVQFGLQILFVIGATNTVEFVVNDVSVATISWSYTYTANQWDDLWLYGFALPVSGPRPPYTSLILVDNYEVDDSASAVSWPAGTAPQLDLARTCLLDPITIPPVPIQTPRAPLTPCVPDVSATNGGSGASGCNDGGEGWESDYPDGPFDAPPEHDNPVAGELLTNARGIQLWSEHRHVDYPSDVVTTYRRSFVELGHLPTYQGGRKTEGLKAIGAVTHSLSNLRDAAVLDISYADQVDRLYRGLLETQTIEMDEYRVKGATAARIAAGLPPRVFIRALVQQAPTTSSPMEATITAVDELFAIHGPLGPQRMFPWKTFGDCGASMPDLTADTKAQVIPVLIGEMSDKGADPQPKGACIGYYCGKFDLTGSGIAVPPDTLGYTFEALVAALQVSVDANTIAADWGGCIGYGDSIVLQALGTVPNTYMRLADIIGFGDLDALLDGTCGGGTTPPPDDTEWGFIAFGLGEFFRYIQVFGSNMGGGVAGVTADRGLLDLMARSDILAPGYIWPFVDNVVTFTHPDTGEVFEISGIWARGQLLEDHIKGVVNITANCIGRMGNAGLPLMHAHTIEQAFYEDCLLGDWTSGPIADDTTYPQFEDDPTVPKVNSASFIERQAWLDAAYGAPFLLTLYATAAQPLAYWHEEFCNATESFTGQNQDGQIVKWGLNPSADPTTAMRIDHVPHMFGKVQRTNVDLENTSVGLAGWDADKQRFTIGPVSRPSTAGIARYKGHVKLGPELKSLLLRDEAQLTWILDRRLERLEFGITKYVVSGTIGFWDVDVGDLVQLTTPEGTGTVGFVDRPCIVLEQGLDFATGIATLKLWDVERLLTP